jgi:hypothetical protein
MAATKLSKANLRDLYRPVGPKPILTNIAWASGGNTILSQAVDLSLPIRGIRLVFTGRYVIGTANFTSFNPEGVLNLLSNFTIQGVNARQQGNITLWNMDLATAFGMNNIFGYRGNGYVTVNSGTGETVAAPPSTPFGTATAYGSGNIGTYDFRIVQDFVFHPMEMNSFGKQPFAVPGFAVRNEEWKDSLQILMTYGAQAGGGAAGVLGLSAATSTIAFSSYGSGAGTPTISLYSLPFMSGLDIKDSYLPGVLSRVSFPITVPLQSAGSGVTLINLQKQPTPRIVAKIGVSTVNPAFSALSDTNLTTLGIVLGGNRNVRNKIDIYANKNQLPDVYDRDPIQGYNVFDFIEQGNFDSSFPGQDIGDGATFQVTGDVTGVANGFGIVVQEQLLHAPAGALYAGSGS